MPGEGFVLHECFRRGYISLNQSYAITIDFVGSGVKFKFGCSGRLLGFVFAGKFNEGRIKYNRLL